MLDLTVYLPHENPDCDCVLVFLNNMIDDGAQLSKCQNNDRCLFSSCSIVSEYFTRKQKEKQSVKINTPAIITSSVTPPLIDFNDQDPGFYPDSKEEQTTTVKIHMEPNIYDDEVEEIVTNMTTTPTPTTTIPTTTTTTTPYLTTPEEIDNEFSKPYIKSLNSELKTYGSANYLIVSWIPFGIIASCLFLSLVIAMISYLIYHKRHTVSFKLVPQTPPII
jgi:hypothetical protein